MIQHDKNAKKGRVNSEVISESMGPRSRKAMALLYSVLSRPHLDFVVGIGQHPVENSQATERGYQDTEQRVSSARTESLYCKHSACLGRATLTLENQSTCL